MNKGDIYLIEIPGIGGHEQIGLRPGIVFSNEIKNIVLIIPITTKTKASTYDFTLKIPKSKDNGLDLDSVGLVFQLRAIDKKRIKNKIGVLEDNFVSQINNLIIEMLKLK